ncbi:MFS transporter [Inquilinus sp. CAU 1745]|uniref:MFS transporter n=1 Tax=Inquilinus sp. CAU 1745 TaxID=3140369 RepID=UPI00325AC434
MARVTHIAPTLLDNRQHALIASIIGLCISVWATNSMVSVTVLPSAVVEIGGVALLSWATTIYITASIVVSASAGWMRARIGLRRGIALGVITFAAGSALCALAPTMPVLLGGRLLQGAGSGLAAALCYILVRTYFPQALWPRIFAMIAAVWGVAALAGPALGGLLTQLVDWRFAYLAMLVPAALLLIMTLAVLPRDADAGRGAALPIGRLSLLAAGILSIGLAANLAGVASAALAVAAGIGLVVLAAALDQRSAEPIFPRAAFSFSSPVGLGLTAKCSMIVSTMPVSIYGAYILQTVHGATPLIAGYLVALEALAWTAAANIVPRLPHRATGAAILAGPLLAGGGMALGAVTLSTGPLPMAGLAIAIMGSGFGICWAFLSGHVMAGAEPGEEDRTASAIPTAETAGIALGAALTGVAGNAFGIAEARTPAEMAATVPPLMAVFIAAAIVALAAAFRIVRRRRPVVAAAG